MSTWRPLAEFNDEAVGKLFWLERAAASGLRVPETRAAGVGGRGERTALMERVCSRGQAEEGEAWIRRRSSCTRRSLNRPSTKSFNYSLLDYSEIFGSSQVLDSEVLLTCGYCKNTG